MTKINSRNRHQKVKQNGETTHESKKKYEEFIVRESLLTRLLDSSLHIRAIYHIFVVIFLVLMCDTVIFNLVENGKINMGLSTVAAGFGDIRPVVKLWVYNFIVSMSLYPLLMVYSWIGTISRKYPVLRPTVVMMGVTGFMALEIAVAAVPIIGLGRKHLEPVSTVVVICEMSVVDNCAWATVACYSNRPSLQKQMTHFNLLRAATSEFGAAAAPQFRFMMKLVAIASTCGPRCLYGTPVPTFKQLIYFMFAPTLLYRDHYPRTKKIRWGVVVFHLLEVAAVIFYISLLWERIIIPYWSDYGKEKTVEVGTVVRAMFASVLPGVISILCGFYCILHAWLNAWAEMLKFGDRLFYEDWWTASCFSQYFRRWNVVVHFWLRDYIYLPLAPYVGRPVATFTVFFVTENINTG